MILVDNMFVDPIADLFVFFVVVCVESDQFVPFVLISSFSGKYLLCAESLSHKAQILVETEAAKQEEEKQEEEKQEAESAAAGSPAASA